MEPDDDETPDIELHISTKGRTIEEIAERLEQMQRELEARLPLLPPADDDAPPPPRS
jgi:hypothetical protein